MAKPTVASKIRKLMTENPEMKPREIAAKAGTSVSHVYVVQYNDRKKAKETPQITLHEPKPDPVNHPAHYKYGGIETIDFIEAKELGYNLGNVVKYITRSDHKGNRKQDLQKALWYLNREIAGV
jgi:hypothetical protein